MVKKQYLKKYEAKLVINNSFPAGLENPEELLQ